MSILVDNSNPDRLPNWNHQPNHINVKDAISTPFNIGHVSKCVGQPQLVNNELLAQLGAKRHFIKGDGSCWSRALWQSVMYQTLDNEKEFNRFINKIAQPEDGYDIPLPLARDTIHIMYKLKNMTNEQRIDYLNHTNVDETLVFFMRHVAGEFMKKNFEIYSAGEIDDIKTNINRYGGPEINAFVRYFNLETHTITKNSSGIWQYQYRSRDGSYTDTNISDMVNKSVKLPHTCIFGASDAHFEAISFELEGEDKPTIIPAKLPENLDIIDLQIKTDHKLAEKLQVEYNKIYEQELEDTRLAHELHRKLNAEIDNPSDTPTIPTTPKNTPAPQPQTVTNTPKKDKTVTNTPKNDKTVKKHAQNPQPNKVKKKGFFSKIGSFVSSIFSGIARLGKWIFSSFWDLISSPFRKK